MPEIRVVDVTSERAPDLARLCIPPEKRADPAFLKGMEAKEAWVREMLERRTPFAKLAYLGHEFAGMIQYEPIPEESVVRIHCIFVPRKEHGNKKVGTRLLETLRAEVEVPQPWNANRPALALTTRTFPGEPEGQLPARAFFQRKGFQPVGKDPDFLFFPLRPGFRYQPKARPPSYVRQPEDEGQALILHGPSFCPFSYPFNQKATQLIEEIAPGILLRWIDRTTEPDAFRIRGGFEGIVVNGKPIQAFVLDRDAFTKEVKEALGGK